MKARQLTPQEVENTKQMLNEAGWVIGWGKTPGHVVVGNQDGFTEVRCGSDGAGGLTRRLLAKLVETLLGGKQ